MEGLSVADFGGSATTTEQNTQHKANKTTYTSKKKEH
jgi:hypothetical protein